MSDPARLSASLNALLTGTNPLTIARRKVPFSKPLYWIQASQYCDLCGMPIAGTSYENLPGGRIGCDRCSSTRLKSTGEQQQVYEEAKKIFESTFHVRLKTDIHVVFAPAEQGTPEAEQWIVYAPLQRVQTGWMHLDEDGFHLHVHHEISRLAVLYTFFYLFTLMWEQENWDLAVLFEQCRKNNQVFFALKAGMAQWAAMELMYSIGEIPYAQEIETLGQNTRSIQAVSCRMFRNAYPHQTVRNPSAPTPFGKQLRIDTERLSQEIQRVNRNMS